MLLVYLIYIQMVLAMIKFIQDIFKYLIFFHVVLLNRFDDDAFWQEDCGLWSMHCCCILLILVR